MYKTNISCIF